MNRRRFVAAAVLLPLGGSIRSAGAQSTPIAESKDGFLIEAHELSKRLAAGEPVKIVALTPPDEFAQGHIPGAAQIDWPELEIVETSDQQVATWRGEVEVILTRLGLAPTDTVAIYDGGTLYAARLWWILEQLGHERKLIVDGGLAAWTSAAGDLETGPSTVAPAPAPYAGTPNDAAIATLPQVRQAFDDPNVALVDARRPEEYSAGHIPGAVNIPFTRNAGEHGRWLEPGALRDLYAAAGVTPDSTVIAYCSSGVRSAVTLFTLRMLGYPDARLFTGSFNEWSSHPELPVTTGERP